MSSTGGVSHACFDCEWEGLGFPCRVGGRPDPLVIARDRVGHMAPEPPPQGANASASADAGAPLPWSWGCIAAVRDPELAWQVILACVRLIETPWQAGLLAASHVEDFVFGAGADFIDRLEEEGLRSPRFRFVLSGMWLHDFDDFDPGSPVRRRIERLQAMGPDMGAGGPLPPA